MVKVDAANDLALLKAEGRFAALPVVASRAMRLGSTVATVGFPNVAQNCILLYRRIVFGRASAISHALQLCHGLRVANPRYSRLKICATTRGEIAALSGVQDDARHFQISVVLADGHHAAGQFRRRAGG